MVALLRRSVLLMSCVVVLSFAATPATATTITVTSTLAVASGLFGQNAQNPLHASISTANPGGTLTADALADVAAGHLGADGASKIFGTGGGIAEAFFLISLSIDDAEIGDALDVNLLLNGSYSLGGGGT